MNVHIKLISAMDAGSDREFESDDLNDATLSQADRVIRSILQCILKICEVKAS